MFQSIELQVDNCKLPSCLSLTAPVGSNEFLNVNGPLQVGGTHIDLGLVASGMNWTFRPWDTGFSGCIRNMTFNGKVHINSELSIFLLNIRIKSL